MQVASASVARTVLPAAPSARPFATALSMYTEAPDLEVSLEEFERRALDRLEGKRAREPRHLALRICNVHPLL